MGERRVEGEGREKSARILVAVYVCEKSGTTYTIQSLVGRCEVFCFYSEWNGKILVDFNQRNDYQRSFWRLLLTGRFCKVKSLITLTSTV